MAGKGKRPSPSVRRTSKRSPGRKRRPSGVPQRLLWAAVVVLVALAGYSLVGERVRGWLAEMGSGPAHTQKQTVADESVPPPVPDPGPQHFDLPDVARLEAPAKDAGVRPAAGSARIALVIDDLGRRIEDVDRIEALQVPVTMAVLPFESRSRQVIGRIESGGHELICHLPMEPASGADPGPGALTSEMTGRQLAAATRRALQAVPGAVGVNNHMGSSLTADRRAMRAILRVVGRRDLYFLDSRTSGDSVGFAVARETGIPAAQRQVFLDGQLTRDWIDGQFARALEIARTEGAAVVIGHPHEVTLSSLEEWVPKALESGYEFVEVSKLLERSGGPAA